MIVSGASSGIGLALAKSVPWPDARVVDVSRRAAAGLEHLAADLADPAQWQRVEHFSRERSGASPASAWSSCTPPGRSSRSASPARWTPPPTGARCCSTPPARRCWATPSCAPPPGDARALPAAADQLGRREPRLRGLVGVLARARRRSTTGCARRAPSRRFAAAGCGCSRWRRESWPPRCRSEIRATPARDFPEVSRFVELFEAGRAARARGGRPRDLGAARARAAERRGGRSPRSRRLGYRAGRQGPIKRHGRARHHCPRRHARPPRARELRLRRDRRRHLGRGSRSRGRAARAVAWRCSRRRTSPPGPRAAPPS